MISLTDGDRMASFLTPIEGIVLDIVFGLLGKSRFNREIDDWGTHYKYVYVALRAPKLTAMHADVNKVLSGMAKSGLIPFQICSFKKGDRYYRYHDFPSSVSLETVRTAWVSPECVRYKPNIGEKWLRECEAIDIFDVVFSLMLNL